MTAPSERVRRRLFVTALGLGLAAYASQQGAAGQTASPAPAAADSLPTTVQEPADDRQVRSTIVRGVPAPQPGPVVRAAVARSGDVTLNFPNVDVGTVAQAVLGDVLGLKFAVDPSVHGVMTLTTPAPIPRRDVLPQFEEALRVANLALTQRGGVYTVVPLPTARGEGQFIGPADFGYGDETIQLKYANAEALKKLLDPIVPNAITQADATRNVLVIAGTTTQRKSVHDLVSQFDVDWLKGMSFGLYIPQRTDSRLIAPELDKLLNSPGASTAGMVRLLAMERLNGIVAITAQPQYLDEVRRWIEVLDREGEGAERRIYVYKVQNGRSADLAKVLIGAFGGSSAPGGPTPGGPGTTPGSTPTFGRSATGAAPPSPGYTTNGQQQTNGQSQITSASQSQFGGSQGGSPSFSSSGVAGPGGEEAGQSAKLNLPDMAATITSDESNNAVVAYATPREYAVLESALRKLDVLPLQVLLEAAITEVTLNDTLHFGVQWYLQAGNLGAGKTSGGFSNGTTSTPTQAFPGYSVMFQHGATIAATLNALSSVTKVNVLSAPALVVLNNQTASLEVGDQIPVSTGSSVSTVSASAPIVNTIEYRDTGVILKVTPRVNDGGLVLLDIAQEVSDVAQNNSSTIDSPVIEQRRIATSIAVQDGQTIALGGLIKNTKTNAGAGIPGLSRIPVLGRLFGDKTDTLNRTELIVLLTPHVIRTAVDAQAITEELRQKIHDLEPPPTTRQR